MIPAVAFLNISSTILPQAVKFMASTNQLIAAIIPFDSNKFQPH